MCIVAYRRKAIMKKSIDVYTQAGEQPAIIGSYLILRALKRYVIAYSG